MPKKRKRSLPGSRRKKKQEFKLGLSFAYINKQLLFLSIGLSVFGVMMVSSASLVLAANDGYDPFHFGYRQIIFLLVGIVAAFILYIFPLKIFEKTTWIALLLSIVLLILVLFIGTRVYGATRWIPIGSFTLQPSEFAKLGVVLFLSTLFGTYRERKFKNNEQEDSYYIIEILFFGFILLLIGGLIIVQPDLDTAVIIAVTGLIMYFVSADHRIHYFGFGVTMLLGVIAVAVLLIIAPYRFERVQAYFDFVVSGEFSLEASQGSAFQIRNCLVASAEGGLFGAGYAQSRGKLYYLSNAAFTDSIYCVTAEELGLVGAASVIIAFLYFMSLGVGIAAKSPSSFGSLMAVGITSWITLQAFLNIGANLAVIPFGGIPLPFVSYGGSSILVTLMGVGLLLNVHKNTELSS